MSDFVYSDMTYCTLCDRYFPGEEARAQHVQVSINHPRCDTCNRRFANKNSLRNHYVYSRRHHYCAVCERDFRTAAGLRAHIEYAAVHRDDSDSDEDIDDIDDSSEGWEDVVGGRVFPEENAREYPDTSEDEEDPNYWTDDDTEDFEEERDSYYGFARAPATAPQAHDSHNAAADTHQPVATSSENGNTESPDTEKAPTSGVFFSCPLCLEAPKESSATRCGHLFCTPCIRTALSNKKMCPVCREFAVPKQLRRIYLSAA
ncbi:RING-type domain-containing protein [Phanerochaete sordida]|uniref:RING-type domain-containing protein n=1 Tax=Phanerochaete sordida TaxID=48140 RepID=A0A9P3LA75_9APHY|nr:RING-type domain-containing protein [Phanerochaete sordida]